MTKTYFMRLFNLFWKSLGFSIVMGLLSVVVKYFIVFITKFQTTTPSLNLVRVIHFLTLSSDTMKNIAICLMIISSVLLAKEIIVRIRYDSLRNLPKSISGTFKIRKFLIHREIIQKDEEPSQINRTVLKYNKAVNHAVIEIWDSQLILYLKLPKEYQAQKMLKDREEEIKEEIASAYPQYLISTFEREKHSLWLKGTRK